MYDESSIFSVSVYAENEYVQLMEEAGTVGVSLCLAFVLIVAASYFRCVWKPRRPVHSAAYGLGFGLLAILIQSATDFGQHDAANACLTASFAALLIVLARHARPIAQRSHSRRRSPTWTIRAVRIAGAVAVICLFVLPILGADRARRARVTWEQAAPVEQLLDNKGWERGSDQDYAALLIPAAEASNVEPQDVLMGYWLNEFRWRCLERYRDPHTGVLTLQEGSMNATARIVSELNLLRAFCPTYGALYSLAGRLEYFVLNRPEGEQDIRTAYRLDHNDPDSCLAMAELDASQKNWQASMAEAGRAIVLDSQGTLGAVLYLFVQKGRPDVAYALVKNDLGGLSSLAGMLANHPEYKELTARCRNETRSLMIKEAQSPNASADLLAAVAQLYDKDGDEKTATDFYEQALVKNYGQVDWRLHLALLMAKAGDYVAAEKEARTCLRLLPNMPGAIALLNELSEKEAKQKGSQSKVDR
jgi:tetratricopeptide (TPR) repeat protein